MAVASGAPSVEVKVDGPGYLRFVQDGRMVYAKKSVLTVSGGRLASTAGPKVAPVIEVASGARALTVDLEGNVSADGSRIGRLVLALFPTDLTSFDAQGFSTSAVRPELGNPGEGTNGVLRTPQAQFGRNLSSQKASRGTDTTEAQGAAAQQASTKPNPTAPSHDSTPTKAANGPGPVVIKVPDRSEVESDSYCLGQIATVEAEPSVRAKLEALDLGDTPPIGIDRILDRSRILARLQTLGLKPNEVSLVCAPRIRVTRKGQTVVNQRFVDAAIKGAEYKGFGSAFEPTTPGPDTVVPLGNLELVCESASGASGDITVMVGIYVDGKRFNGRMIHLRSTSPVMNVKAGMVVSVKVVRSGVSIETKGKVIKTDSNTSQVTVQIVDTGAQLTGTMRADGTVEIKA